MLYLIMVGTVVALIVSLLSRIEAKQKLLVFNITAVLFTVAMQLQLHVDNSIVPLDESYQTTEEQRVPIEPMGDGNFFYYDFEEKVEVRTENTFSSYGEIVVVPARRVFYVDSLKTVYDSKSSALLVIKKEKHHSTLRSWIYFNGEVEIISAEIHLPESLKGAEAVPF